MAGSNQEQASAAARDALTQKQIDTTEKLIAELQRLGGGGLGGGGAGGGSGGGIGGGSGGSVFAGAGRRGEPMSGSGMASSFAQAMQSSVLGPIVSPFMGGP